MTDVRFTPLPDSSDERGTSSQGTLGTWGLAGLAAGVVGAGRGALRGLGYTKVGPRKPEWPFLYTLGGRPDRRGFARIARAIDRLRT